jgi:hypothetical protein
MDAAASSFVDDADRQMSPSRSRTVNAEAHEAALRGRFLLERRTADDLRQALVWFERAISAKVRTSRMRTSSTRSICHTSAVLTRRSPRRANSIRSRS